MQERTRETNWAVPNITYVCWVGEHDANDPVELRRWDLHFQDLCIVFGRGSACSVDPRVSFGTSFDWKQPKLEPKLVSALSETKLLFRLFFSLLYRNREVQCFDWMKQTEDQSKQFDREHILQFFTENLGFYVFFDFFIFFFCLFQNSLFR